MMDAKELGDGDPALGQAIERVVEQIAAAKRDGFRLGLEAAALWHERMAEAQAPGTGGAARHQHYAERLRAMKIAETSNFPGL